MSYSVWNDYDGYDSTSWSRVERYIQDTGGKARRDGKKGYIHFYAVKDGFRYKAESIISDSTSKPDVENYLGYLNIEDFDSILYSIPNYKLREIKINFRSFAFIGG